MKEKEIKLICKVTVTQVVSKTTNTGFLLVTQNEFNELILIANKNPLVKTIYALSNS